MKVSFLIVGTQKGGTTALSKYLSLHPDTCFYLKKTTPPLHKEKEIHFFDNDSFFTKAPPPYNYYHNKKREAFLLPFLFQFPACY